MASEKESQWIDRYIETGNANQATREIFNSSDKNVPARSCALKNTLGSEIDKRLRKAMRHNSVSYFANLAKLATESDSDQVRVKALTDLLDRGGYKPVDQMEDVTEHVMTKGEHEQAYQAAQRDILLNTDTETLKALIDSRDNALDS